MKRSVSRFTNNKPCTKCGNEPRRPGQRWGNNCFAEYNRHQRALEAIDRAQGRTVRARLSPDELAHIEALRNLPKPAGRHHVRST